MLKRNLRAKQAESGADGEEITFCYTCPHRDDYEELIEKLTAELYFEKDAVGKVTLRFGVFPYASQEPEIEQRFVFANIAAKIVANDPTKTCGYYP